MPFTFLSHCSTCGATNRIPTGHLADRGRCGACKAELAPVAEPINVNETEFDEIVQSSNVPVLVDFWASWCQPCKAAAPEVHQVARDVPGRALVLKVDTEANPRLAARFGVQSIPNFMIFQDGKPVFSRPGFARRADMRAWLREFAV